MIKTNVEASAEFALSLKVAKQILSLISEPKVILNPEGTLIAESASVDDAFRLAALKMQGEPDGEEASGFMVARLFPVGTPLAGHRLIERKAQGITGADPSLLHDLRDLLHSLQLSANAVGTQGAGGAEHAQVAAIATQVEMLLAGHEQAETVELRHTLASLAQAIGPGIAEAGATLCLDLPTDEISSRLPRGALLRLVQNLLLNAARQSPGGEVTLALRQNENTAVIEISDAGEGLSAERLAWLTAAEPTAGAPKPQGGHGYGLHIVREALRQIGARLEQLPGMPHRLRLYLPAAQTSNGSRNLAGRRLWLVENNPTSADVVARLLSAAGATTQILTDGEALLEAAADAKTPPDLVLCDYHLADHDGAGLSQLLTSAGFAASIVILTADAEPETFARCILSGAVDVWLKPLSGAALVDRLRTLLATDLAPSTTPIFDPEIATELLEETGLETMLRFMQRALQEARDITPLCASGDIPLIRSALHSAIGATGITGLHQLNQGLKELHAQVASHLSIETDLRALEHAITVTALKINGIEEFRKNSVPSA